MRKGQGLSVNMMILLVLGVIVLVISVAMLVSKSKSADKTTGSCEYLGGVCLSACDPGQEYSIGKCTAPQVCCSRPDSQNTQT